MNFAHLENGLPSLFSCKRLKAISKNYLSTCNVEHSQKPMASVPIDRKNYLAMLCHQLINWNAISFASQLLKLSGK